MAVFNYLRKEIDAKIVYYGPGVSGKTTNLQYIHQHLKQDQRGKMVSLATDEDRTLFFDFLPIELESVRGFKTRFHLYTVPGQVFYGATRRAVLTGADGVIFVADSQADRLEENLLSLKDLEENLRYYGKKIETSPFVVQYNKRDLPNVLPVEELNQKINRLNVPYFEAVAVLGKGVFETLTLICRLVLKAIETGVETRRPAGMSDTAPGAPPAKTPSRAEKSIPRPESPVAAADTARGLRLERDIARSEPPRSVQDRVPARTALRMGKDATPPESPRPVRMPPIEGAKSGEETSPASGRAVLGRLFDKKKPEPPTKPEEEGARKVSPVKETIRILSCGQPRVSSPNSLEIPLTLEVDSSGKSLSVNLAIKLEQLDQKVT
jgi:signal recognition particle receptor subunit beta